MKIGILTFHCAHNYGAVLQAYGLQEYLKNIGHEVYIIDFRPSYITNGYQKFSKFYWLDKKPNILLKKIRTEPLLFIQRYLRWKAFNSFINKRLHLYPFENLNKCNLDAIIVGSDQIWNSKISNGQFEDVYFGQGANCIKISYAASSRSKVLTPYEKEYYIQHLPQFKAISVRESSLQKLLQPLVDIPIQVTLDPTLLAGVNIFKNISTKFKKKNFILLYEVEEHPDTYRIAKSLKNQLKTDLVELVAPLSVKRLFKKNQTASPEDFIGYIQNASCVVTSSFHGVALSILFNKPFYAIRQNTEADLRTESLLDKLKLENRFISLNSTPCFSSIDYTVPNIFLISEQQKSITFLKEALS